MVNRMRTNSKTKIIGNKVVLVPYRKKHVKRYNEWMQSKELQELTASEPLTEDEEYEMQRTWLQDDDKCTFIVLDKETLDSTGSEEESMIGDTNLYLSENGSDIEAETGIMIAELCARKKRMGWEAMLLAMRYGIEELNIHQFTAKISMNNEKSICLFEKMNFTKASESDVFQEVTLVRPVTENWVRWVVAQTDGSTRVETEENV